MDPLRASADARVYGISELAREFDVTARAIRFYEDQGLLAPSRCGPGGQRRVYGARDRTRLMLLLRGKRLGLSLAEIRSLLDMYETPADSIPQMRRLLALLAERRQALRRQLQDLQATLADLDRAYHHTAAALASRLEAAPSAFLAPDCPAERPFPETGP